MRIGLGIDTGGTCTDAVLYDLEGRRILASAKAPTTHHDLVIGIRESVESLPADLLRQTVQVSLSTTLATNACVEGRGARCALFLMGYDPNLYARISREYGLPETVRPVFLAGRHGMQGEVKEAPDWERLENEIRNLPAGVRTLAVCEYGGIFNPEFEQEAAERIRRLTDRPVTAAHELSRQVNSLKRAASTCLNARLIPLIRELLDAVRTVLSEKQVNAPLMIVRGDGTLMTAAFADAHPVETMLSGPAASVIGGMNLADEKNCVLIDMGGTTTDIALVENGRTRVDDEGVSIGEWRTGTAAIEIATIGLGGDSLITMKGENLVIGPGRAMPLCRLAVLEPRVLDVLRKMKTEERCFTYSRAEFLTVLRAPDDTVTGEDRRVMDALADGPLSLEELGEKVGKKPYFLHTESLESLGYILRAGLTPTDLMHADGEFEMWSTEAAKLGLELFAGTMQKKPREIDAEVRDRMAMTLYSTVAEFLLKRLLPRGSKLPKEWVSLMWNGGETPIAMKLVCPWKLVALGAPTRFFLDRTARKLATGVAIPNHAEVSNAIGAITGRITGEEVIWIRPKFTIAGIEGYACHGSTAFAEFEDLDDAVAWSKAEAEKAAVRKAEEMGAAGITVECTAGERSFSRRGGGSSFETMVRASAVGRIGVEA